jgi:FtsZ-binding cell division protein ZapB
LRESTIDHLIKIKEARLAQAVRLIQTLTQEIEVLKKERQTPATTLERNDPIESRALPTRRRRLPSPSSQWKQVLLAIGSAGEEGTGRAQVFAFCQKFGMNVSQAVLSAQIVS